MYEETRRQIRLKLERERERERLRERERDWERERERERERWERSKLVRLCKTIGSDKKMLEWIEEGFSL